MGLGLKHLLESSRRRVERLNRYESEWAALVAGSRRAKTAKPVECEASQSGAKRNAQRTPHD